MAVAVVEASGYSSDLTSSLGFPSAVGVALKRQKRRRRKEKQQITYKGVPIRLSADFSAGILLTKREWHNILKVMKEENLHQYSTCQGSQGSH